jgi:hypothetical protein
LDIENQAVMRDLSGRLSISGSIQGIKKPSFQRAYI